MANILLIEDSSEISKMVEALLSPTHELKHATTLHEAAERLRLSPAMDLLLLDVDLPDGSGFEFFSRLKEELEEQGTRTIFLTGTNTVSARTQGFSLGAIDYIPKPFDPIEFQVRVNSRLRQQEKVAQDPRLSSLLQRENLEIDLTRGHAFARVGGTRRQLDLTPVEFRLLLLFAQNPSNDGTEHADAAAAVTREEILEKVWGETAHVSSRCVDHHVCGLRKKIAPVGFRIKPVYGIGYRLEHTG